MEPVKSHDPNAGHHRRLQQPDIDILETEIPRPRVFSDSTDDLLLASDAHVHDETASQTETDSLHAPTRAASPHRNAASGSESEPASTPAGHPSSPRAMQLHIQFSEDSSSPSQEPPLPRGLQLPATPSTGGASRAVAKDSKRIEPNVSPSEFEMDDLQLSSTGTWTTKSTWRSEKKRKHHRGAAGNRHPNLNYKPMVLRWPYQALLLFIIAGFFAFLEYEIHSLPQPYVQLVPFAPGVIHVNKNFGLLDYQQPGTTASPAPKSRRLNTAHLAPTSTTTGAAGGTSTTATQAPLNTAMLMARGVLTASPDPNPIPPSTVYPTPGVSITKYFGWGPPAWYAAPRYDLSNDQNVTWEFYQWIPFFTTKSEVPLSWCPCNVDLQVSLESGDLWIFRPSPGIALSGDASCQAIMITLINFYRIMHQVSVFDTDDVPDYMRTMRNRAAAISWTTTPPAPVSVPWAYPITTNSEGAMVIALEVKTSTTLAFDVFGTAVTQGFPWTGFITARDNDKTMSTVLWTLPYSKPTASPLITTTTSMSSTQESALPTSSSVIPQSTTSLTSTTEMPTGSVATTPFLAVPSTTTQAQEESSSAVAISSSIYSTLTSTLVAPTTTTSEESTSTSSTSLQLSESPHTTTSSSQIPSSAFSDSVSGTASHSVVSTLTSATGTSSSTPGSLTESSSLKLQTGGASSITSASPTQKPKASALSNSNNPTASTTGPLSSSPAFATETSPETSTAETTTVFGQPLIVLSTSSSSSSTTSSAEPPVVLLPPVVPFLGSFLGSLLGSSGVPTTTTPTQSLSAAPASISSYASPEGTNTPYPSLNGPNPTELPSAGTGTGMVPNTATPAATGDAQPDATRPGNTLGQAQVTASPTGHAATPPTEPSYPEGPISPNSHFFNLQTEADYLLASVVPVLLATLLSIPIQVFTSSINHMLPFKALRQPTAATAEDSLNLPRGSLLAPVISVRFLQRFKDPLPILNVLLGLLATLLVPLSSETIRLEYLPFECHSTVADAEAGATAKPCPIGLRVSGMPTRAAEALLAVIAAVIVLMAFLLWRWRSGLATEPWSIAAMASMLSSSGPELKALMASMPPCADGVCLRSGEVEKTFKGKRFHLGGPDTHNPDNKGQDGHGGGAHYGIHTISLPEAEDTGEVRLTAQDPPRRSSMKPRTSPASPFDMEFFGRILFLVFIGGLLILILYYENSMLHTGFETFMDSQTFGVRILFTGMGSIISIFWDFQFSRVAENQLYQRLTKQPQPAQRSILLSPPSSVFTGLWSYVSTKDVVSANVALAALLAKFTPILLSNIPFRNTVTWKTHEACTWLAVGVLGYMFVVLFASLWVRRAYMPIAPGSIAGCMYYVCDSAMLKDFEGLACVGRKERNRLVGEMDRRFIFGEIVGGAAGERRIGVDYLRLEQRAAGWKPGRF